MYTYDKVALAFSLLILLSYAAFAQLPALSVDPVETQLQTVTILGNQSQTAVTGAPYSAIEESLYSQKQPDGTYDDRSSITTHMYRDGQGRTRAERYVTSYITGDHKPWLKSIFIINAQAGVLYRLEPKNRTAMRSSWHANMGALSDHTNTAGHGALTDELNSSATAESLGTTEMAGLTVEGTRQTLTVPVGAHDNERPFRIELETWISPELKVLVLSKRDNFIVGMRTTRLTGIDRSEPDPALFRVPSDYTIEDAPAEGGSSISVAPTRTGTTSPANQ